MCRGMDAGGGTVVAQSVESTTQCVRVCRRALEMFRGVWSSVCKVILWQVSSFSWLINRSCSFNFACSASMELSCSLFSCQPMSIMSLSWWIIDSIVSGVHCRWWSESTHTTSPKPNTAQKLWNKTMVEAELYEASPPNDQTRTVTIELPIKTSNKNYTHSTSVGSDSLGRWFYNWDSHWSPNQLPLSQV